MDSVFPDTIIQPFSIHFDCNDYHIIAFFEGHPEYESIEAMIQERDDSEPYIRAIITYRNKTQTDYINDNNIFKKIRDTYNKDRGIYCTPIFYLRKKKLFREQILIKFTSSKGEEIVMECSPASKPAVKYAGLIDPLGHSKNTSLPVMYPARTTLMGSRSKVVIDGMQYNIPVKVHVPLFFTGLNGFYSEVFNIGILRSGKRLITLLNSPERLETGEKWVYKSNNEKMTYTISQITGSNISVKGRNEEIIYQITESGPSIKHLTFFSSCNKYKNSEFYLDFNPPILIHPTAIDSVIINTSSFSIGINENKSLVSGVLTAESRMDSVKLIIKPAQPEWAVERLVTIETHLSGNNFIIDTKIG